MTATTAIGLMSGSSLDGLDMALVRFTEQDNNSLNFAIVEAETLPYPKQWQTLLSEAFNQHPSALEQLNLDYGCYIGQQVRTFAQKHHVQPDFVASHGHTIFHRPHEGYTLQIGDGQAIADACGFTVVNDFRTLDVAKGGQGAPLVPIGDQQLFGCYEICLNIGGIANLSYEEHGQRRAYDLCIANQALNHLAQQVGQPYDHDGQLARSGRVDAELLQRLTQHPFYNQQPPKSLGREFFEANQRHLLQDHTVANLLATMVEHIAMQIAQPIAHLPKGKILATGGGARNSYLMERLQSHTKHQVVIPEPSIVDYKEALVFALLGLLRLKGQTNVLASVTGAESDSCSGHIWCCAV